VQYFLVRSEAGGVVVVDDIFGGELDGGDWVSGTCGRSVLVAHDGAALAI
jgi:hypothetical protein